MRSEENPLDLNNLPEDYTRDGRQPSEDSSSSAVGGAASGGVVYRRKRGGGGGGAKDGKEDSGKVYECRFCSLKFCKSQALGGHMNRHRQERETETLNKARQLVFTNDLAPGHIAYVSGNGQPIGHGGGYHQPSGTNNMGGCGGNGGDPSLMSFRSMYPPPARLFSTSSPPLLPPPPPPQPQTAAPPPPYMYASPPHLMSFHSPPPVSNNDYFVGHVLSSNEGNYTCIGAPVGHGFPNGGGSGGAGGGVREVSLLMNQEEGLSWGRR